MRSTSLICILLTLSISCVGGSRHIKQLEMDTSGKIGCAPHDIVIDSVSGSIWGSTRSWEATCNGVLYYCSRTGNLNVPAQCTRSKDF